jgi:hypothetical protein
MSPIRIAPRFKGRLALPLLALGVAGFAAAWVALALLTGRQCSWMAPLAALDAALLLRLGGMAPGWRRAAWALLATALMIALAQWGIIAAQLGAMLGLDPLTSALRLGPSLAWTLAQLANQPGDLLWLGAGLALAVLAAR